MTLEEQINKIISQHWVHLEHDEIIAELAAFVRTKEEAAYRQGWRDDLPRYNYPEGMKPK